MARIDAKTAGGHNVLAFLDMIAVSEGVAGRGDDGYNLLVGYGKFQDYSHHPNQLVTLFVKATGKSFNSTAAGRYQILYRTWVQLMARHHYLDFSPVSQDMAAIQLIRDAGAFADVEAGHFASAVVKCKRIWASLPGAGYGQHENQLATLEEVYKRAGGIVEPIVKTERKIMEITTAAPVAVPKEVPATPTPGFKSTEFAATIVTILGVVLGAVPQQYVPLVAALTGLYVAARTVLKAVHTMGYAKALPDLPAVPAQLLPAGTTTTTITQVPKP